MAALETDEESTTGRGILSAIRLTSLTSILTITFGIATNKVIAVVAGTEGVGLLGLYRTLGGILTAVLPLGVNDIVVQRLSTARERRTTEEVIGASISFLAVQILVILCVAVFAAPLVASWLFTTNDVSHHLWEIRLALGLTIGILALQSVSASLNGLLRLREVNRVNLLTSVFTLATVYPFLLLGRIGLTFVIGFTCFIGAGLGAIYLRRAMGSSLSRLARPRSWDAFRAALPISPWLALQPLLNTGSALAVQVALSHHYGLTPLGHYNAAAMLETTAITVLMSSMRSYTLPGLGRFATFAEKRLFVNKILSVLLVLLLGGAIILVAGAPLIVKILFSGAFEPAREIVRVLAISMVGQVLVWCSAMFLLHGADYRTYLLLDGVWASVRVVGTVLCATFDAPVESVAWVHAGSYSLSALCYTIAVRARYRAFLVDRMNALLSLVILALLIGARFVFLRQTVGYQVVFTILVAILCGAAGTVAWRRMRS